MRRAKRPLAAVAFAAAAGLAGSAGAQEVVCGRTVTSFAQIAAELAADPKLSPMANGGTSFVAYWEASPPRQWLVTKPEVAEIQAVICRALQESGGRFFVRVESRCFGPKPACDRVVALVQQPPS